MGVLENRERLLGTLETCLSDLKSLVVRTSITTTVLTHRNRSEDSNPTRMFFHVKVALRN